MTGAVVSCIVMVNDFSAVFPARSVTVQVTVVVPIGNLDPDGGVHVGVSGPST